MSERERENMNNRRSNYSASTTTSAAPKRLSSVHTVPIITGVQRVTDQQALTTNPSTSRTSTTLGSAKDLTSSNSIYVSNTGNTPSERVSKSSGSASVTSDSLNAVLDAKFDELLNKLLSLPAGDGSLLSSVNDKITSLESQIKHQGSLLANLVLELHEFRKQNAELTNELVRMRSLETRSDGCNSNNLDSGESCDNIISSPNSTPPLSLSPLAPVFSPTHSIVEGTEVVNDGELIITNFIDNDKADYSKIAFTVLTTLEPSITPSDITLARPLSVPPKK